MATPSIPTDLVELKKGQQFRFSKKMKSVLSKEYKCLVGALFEITKDKQFNPSVDADEYLDFKVIEPHHRLYSHTYPLKFLYYQYFIPAGTNRDLISFLKKD